MSTTRDSTVQLGDIFLFRENIFDVAIQLPVTSLDGLNGASGLKLALRSSPSTA